MSTLICRHIKTNGARCGSPALPGQVFCYFHNNAARRHQTLKPIPVEPAILHPLSRDPRDR
jgi:hypothetical protein